MKVSGKGILIIVLFLVIIPVVTEVVLMVVLPKDGPKSFSMTRPLFLNYVKFIPIYIIYLVVAFAIIYLIKNWKKITNQEK